MGTKKTIRISTDGKKVNLSTPTESKLTKGNELLKVNKKKYDGRANLIPCKKGEVRNPNGRPVGSTSIKSKLLRLLKNYRPSKDVHSELKKKYPQIAKYEDCTIDDAIWVRVLDQAIRGNDNAREFIAERTEGRVVEKVDFGIDVATIQLNIDTSASSAPEPVQDDTDVSTSND